MPRWTTRQSFAAVAVVCAALALNAYGLGATAAFAKSSKPTVAVAKVTAVGTVLVDAKAKTLYTLTNDGKAVPCTGACAGLWPPLFTKPGSKPKGGPGVTGLGTAKGGQVTHTGIPLYRYSGDTRAGQANGEGLSDFGGTWHVVKVAGARSGTGATPTTGAPSSSSTNSYGY